MRIWAPVMGGPMGPVRGKTMTVRVRELADVIAALQQAKAILDGGQPGCAPVPGSARGRGNSGSHARAPAPDFLSTAAG